jgi:hypothetical protein
VKALSIQLGQAVEDLLRDEPRLVGRADDVAADVHLGLAEATLGVSGAGLEVVDTDVVVEQDLGDHPRGSLVEAIDGPQEALARLQADGHVEEVGPRDAPAGRRDVVGSRVLVHDFSFLSKGYRVNCIIPYLYNKRKYYDNAADWFC